MRPTAMQKSMNKERGSMKSSAPPPTPPKHATTITVVCNGSGSAGGGGSGVRSPTSSQLTSPLEPRLSGGDFGKKRAPPPPVSPRDKVGATSQINSSAPTPKSQVTTAAPPSANSQPAVAPKLRPKSYPAPPPPTAKSPHSVISVTSSAPSAASASSVRSSAPPPVLPRSMSSGSGVAGMANAADGVVIARGDRFKNSNSNDNNNVSNTKSGSATTTTNNNNSICTTEADDFFSSLPSLPPDDYVAPYSSHYSADGQKSAVLDSSYYSFSSSASSSPGVTRTDKLHSQSHSSYSSIPSSPASSVLSSTASSPTLSLKLSVGPRFPASSASTGASDGKPTSPSDAVSHATLPPSPSVSQSSSSALAPLSSAPALAESSAMFNSSLSAPSSHRVLTSVVDRKGTATTIIVNKGPPPRSAAAPTPTPTPPPPQSSPSPTSSTKTSDFNRSFPVSPSSPSTQPLSGPPTPPPLPPVTRKPPPPPVSSRKQTPSVVSRPPPMTGIAENGSFMGEREEEEEADEESSMGASGREVFHVNMKGWPNGVPGAPSTGGAGGGAGAAAAEPTFAGRRDVKDPRSVSEKRIVSSKGTVRGFKNRVRAGIVTFIEQTPNKSEDEVEDNPPVFDYRVTEKGKIVVYTTSMNVVRETSERCKATRNILQNHMVRYEERDLYMSHDNQRLLRERLAVTEDVFLPLPQVFLDGIHIGGATDLEKLNETGELRQILLSFPKIQVRTMCDKCGGYRFVPCVVCHGSKKSVHRNNFTEEFCALRCMHCNENGLQRCQDCIDQQE